MKRFEIKVHPSVQRIIDQQALPPEQREVKTHSPQPSDYDAIAKRAADANARAEAARAALEALAAPTSVQRAIATLNAIADERKRDPEPYRVAPAIRIAWAQRETFRRERQARAEATLEAVPQR